MRAGRIWLGVAACAVAFALALELAVLVSSSDEGSPRVDIFERPVAPHLFFQTQHEPQVIDDEGGKGGEPVPETTDEAVPGVTEVPEETEEVLPTPDEEESPPIEPPKPPEEG